jgi:hypothetical protein
MADADNCKKLRQYVHHIWDVALSSKIAQNTNNFAEKKKDALLYMKDPPLKKLPQKCETLPRRLEIIIKGFQTTFLPP